MVLKHEGNDDEVENPTEDPAWRRFADDLRGDGAGTEEALRGVGIHGSMLIAANALALARKSFEDAARYPLTTMDADRQLRVAERMLLIAEVATRVARNIEGK
jgi:hypothetical protein